MKIGIDARFAIKKRRGIGNYVLSYLSNLAKLDTFNEYILYIDGDDSDKVLPVQDNFKIRKMYPVNYLFWEQILLPIQAYKDNIDILHCTGNTAPCYLFKNIKLLTTIHDVMYYQKNSQLIPKPVTIYQKIGRIYRKLIVRNSIFNASKIITISNFSKNDILKIFPTIRNEDIIVIPEAGAEHIIENDCIIDSYKLEINNEYILSLGAVDPRKNTKMIIEVFFELKKKENIKEKLVIAGLKDWKKTKFYKMVEKSEYKKEVLFLPFLHENDLVSIYKNAKIFLYPSLYEGFGFPPLEAMMCKVPVITSNVTAIPEVVGDAAILVDPTNKMELYKAILKVLKDDCLRKQLIIKGMDQSQKYSWKITAKKTLDVYNMIYKGE